MAAGVDYMDIGYISTPDTFPDGQGSICGLETKKSQKTQTIGKQSYIEAFS